MFLGPPKAVMISHDNLTWTPGTTLCHVEESTWGRGKERMVSYLPLSHIAGQLLDMHAPMYMCAELGGSCTIYFAQPDALKGSLATYYLITSHSTSRCSPLSLLL